MTGILDGAGWDHQVVSLKSRPPCRLVPPSVTSPEHSRRVAHRQGHGKRLESPVDGGGGGGGGNGYGGGGLARAEAVRDGKGDSQTADGGVALGLLAVELDRRGVACGHRGEQSGWAGGDGDEEEGLGEVLLWGEQR